MLLTKDRRWVQPSIDMAYFPCKRRPAVVAAAMQHVQQRHQQGRLQQQLGVADLCRLALCSASSGVDSPACHFLAAARAAGWELGSRQLPTRLCLRFLRRQQAGGQWGRCAVCWKSAPLSAVYPRQMRADWWCGRQRGGRGAHCSCLLVRAHRGAGGSSMRR